MNGWTSFVVVCAIMVAIAAFIEKFYKSDELDNSIRDKIVSFYIKIEHLLLRIGWNGVLLFVICSILSVTDIYEYYFVSSLPNSFSKLFMFLGLIVFIPSTIGAIVGLFLGIYAIISSLTYHVISKSSSPKTSPITYLVAIISLVAAVAKGILDIVKIAAT